MRMKKILCLCLFASVVAGAQSAMAQKLSDAFIDIKEKQLRKSFPHLALLPIAAAPAAAVPDSVLSLISAEVKKLREKEDFTLLPPQETSAIETQFKDLYTNPQLAKNQEVISEHTIRELFHRHPVDGLVSVQVLPVAAPFVKDRAEWGGTTQKVEHRGDGLFGALTGKGYQGHIAASAIRIVISARSGKPLYNWMGGVELMMRRNGKKLEPLPTEELWQNDKRIIKAIKYALKPF